MHERFEDLIFILAGIVNIAMPNGSILGKTGSIILGIFCVSSGIFTILLEYIIPKHNK